MRRLFIFLMVAMLAFGALKAIRSGTRPPHHYGPHHPQRDLAADARRKAQQAAAEASRAIREAGHEVRQAWHETRQEIGRAYQEARDEIRQAYHEALADDEDGRTLLPPPPSNMVPEREDAEGLPVPIVPGTRVTRAEARPPVPSRPPASPRPQASPRLASQARPPAPVAPTAPACEDSSTCCEAPTAAAEHDYQRILGEIGATEDRARAEARKALQTRVATWLKPDVPASWTPPARLLQSLLVETKIEPHVSQRMPKDDPLNDMRVYVATMTADLSPRRRAELVDAYTHELVKHRLLTLGGSLGFVLICLAAVSGYIRADEATKGYYTNRLRMLAAAGVGAAGVIVFRMVA
jgi:hypothetical protein